MSGGVGFTIGDDEEHGDVSQVHDKRNVFVEMLEFHDGVWTECGRWVKFEELVEPSQAWSKPHVATLSMKSLLQLQGCLHSSYSAFDVQMHSFYDLIVYLSEKLAEKGDISAEMKETFVHILMLQHVHQREAKESKSMHKTFSRAFSSKALVDEEAAARHADALLQIPEEHEGGNKKSAHNLTHHKENKSFARKLAPGTEAASILIGTMPGLNKKVTCFLKMSTDVVMEDLSEVSIPIRFVFVCLGPDTPGDKADLHEVGRCMGAILSDQEFHDIVYDATSKDDLFMALHGFMEHVTCLPPGEWNPDIRLEPPAPLPKPHHSSSVPNFPGEGLGNGGNGHALQINEPADLSLVRTGRLFGGVVADVKRKIKHLKSDWTDILYVQMIASIIFLFFACLSPIVTFGGLLGHKTGNNLAAFESILTALICGTTFHVFAGQPMTIIGSTGPVLVFESVMFSTATAAGMEYLTVRFWVCMWTSAMLLIIVMFDLSSMVRYISRFTEECFATLIAIIFIAEAIKSQFKIAAVTPWPDPGTNYTCDCTISNVTAGVDCVVLNNTMCSEEAACELTGNACEHPPVPDVFFFSCLLFLLTYLLAIVLKSVRESGFFPNKVREIISDFAVTIAIFVAVMVDLLVGLDTPKLEVPVEFRPTNPNRGWVVDPFANPWWTIFAAIIPALLASILIFMDQQITAVIVNRKENKLKKGCGYHLDLFVICIHIVIVGWLGLPIFVAATVLSINHVNSLRIQSTSSAPGEKPQFLGIREQRVSGLVIFLLIGLSIFFTKVLRFIPMSVLFGVFLYMGSTALKDNQFFDRLLIFFMPEKYQPNYLFLRYVRTWRVHLFTLIQLISFALLYTIKSITITKMFFPLMVAAMVFIRFGLAKIFTAQELEWLDDTLPNEQKLAKHKKSKRNDSFPSRLRSRFSLKKRPKPDALAAEMEPMTQQSDSQLLNPKDV